MQRLMIWCQRHPYIVITVLLVITTFAAYMIPRVRLDASAEGMMIQGDPDQKFYQETLKKFGTDNITIIYIQDKNLFTPEKLKELDNLQFALEELPGVSKLESLYTVTNFKGEDGGLNTSPLIEWVPDTIEEAEKIKINALNNPILIKNLISKDATATAINLFVDGDPDDPEFNTAFSLKVDEVIDKYSSKFGKIFQFGNSYTKRSITEKILGDQKTLVPLSAFVLLMTLFIMMRSANGAILPMITAGTSVIWTTGFMGFMGIPLNILTVIVPSLIIVIGSTEDIHLLSEYMEGLEQTGKRSLAIRYMANKTGTAVLLTAITTFLGFLSITINKIVILKQFGIVSSFGLFVNPIITVTLVPVYMSMFGAKKVSNNKLEKKSIIENFLNSLANLIISIINKNKWLVFGILMGLAIVIGTFTYNIKVNNDFLAFFKASSPIRKRSMILHKELSGAQPFYICINSGQKGAFKKSENLKQIALIQDFMKSMGCFDQTTSLADYIALINREMNDGNEEFYRIPNNSNLIPQYLLTLQRDEIERFVTSDYSEVNILVRHNISSSYQLKKALNELNGYMKKIVNPYFKYRFTGENILINKAADSMAVGQAKSLSFLLVIIFIIMCILFVNIKAGALSIIPNVFPIMFLFGIMGLFDIPLNTGTAMVAAIAIGIAVDDTVHFMTRYNKEMRVLQSQQKAMEVCISSEITPVFSTSLALALGFSVVCFSSFVPLMYFGFLSAFVMIFALIGDLFITPILLSSTQLITIIDILGLKLHDAVIKDSKLFKNLKTWQIKKIILLGKVLTKEKDEYAVNFGETGHSMYLLLEGRAKVLAAVKKEGEHVVVDELNPGDVFGEIALVEPGPRSADIVADDHIKYIEIDWAGLHRMQRIFPRIAGKLFLNLSQILGGRLIHTNQLLLEASKKIIRN